MSNNELRPFELEALLYMSHGYSNRLIAVAVKTRHYVTEETVKQALRRAYRKLDAVDRAHATRLGFEKGILKPCAPDCSVCANGPRRK